MRFLCLLGFHKLKPVSVCHTKDGAWGIDGFGNPTTIVTYCCSHCGGFKSDKLNGSGFLTLEQVKGMME